jgi:hypothetical protein
VPYIVLLLANAAGVYFIRPWRDYLITTWHTHDHHHLLVAGIVLGSSLVLAFFWDRYLKRDGSFVNAAVAAGLLAALGVTCYLEWVRKPVVINHTQVIRQTVTNTVTRTVTVNHWYSSWWRDVALAVIIAVVLWLLKRGYYLLAYGRGWRR